MGVDISKSPDCSECSSYFCIGHDQSNSLRKERFLLVHCLRNFQSIQHGKAGQSSSIIMAERVKRETRSDCNAVPQDLPPT